MIEKILLDYLSDALPVPCYVSMPEKPSGSFCVLEKTGSGPDDGLNHATIAVQSYGTHVLEAASLNLQVIAAMRDAVALPAISSCERNTDYNFPDTTRRLPRYQAVFDLVYYD